jgi:hypothetical protein
MLRCRLASGPLVAGLLIVTSGLACAEPKALVELFTSQGCSSCPPADKLLGELAADPSLIAISDPIDYWDYLGWKDTLAMPGHSARQRAYAHVRGDREVYTPQVVVNGSADALGSDRAAIERAIVQTDQKSFVMSLPVLLSLGGSLLNINVQAKGSSHPGEVWLCPLARAVTVAVGRGENHGHTITYHNVVRGWTKLGDWNGADANWSIPVSAIEVADDVDAAVVMVQEGTHEKPGVILGAAYLPIAQLSPSEARHTTNVK